MRGAVSSVSGTLGDAPAGYHAPANSSSSPEVLARRAKQRRYLLDMTGASYVADAVILLIYAYAGTTSVMVAAAYGICGLLSVAVFIALSEARVTDRSKNRYSVVPQTSVDLAIMMLFLYIAPEVGCVFLCAIFLIYTFAALRSTPLQTLIGWITATVGLTALFLFTDKPIAMPHDTPLERFATMLVFVSVLGRGMVAGLFSNSLYEALYKRGVELKEAYKRIEELAELDELTGAYNRRSIMRMLQDEIMRSQHGRMPCAVVLIDLDWFKQVNDRFGHPIGDEVLRTFAITIFANIRSIDRLGRYGGEEFLLILPETADGAAHRIVDRLRTIVADLDWSAISHGMTITMSAGLTMVNPQDTPDTVLTRADSLLYQAKDMGRNKVLSA